MGHRAKHRRANWIPERLEKAIRHQAVDDNRKAADAARKAAAQVGVQK